MDAPFFRPVVAGEGWPGAGLFPPPSASCEEYGSAVLTDTFMGHQSTNGYVTQGDALADLIVFSGVPDRIEITCLSFPVLVQFTDEQGRVRPEIRIEAGGAYDAQLRARKVRARNATAGSNALVQVIGKWAVANPGYVPLQ